MRRLGIAQTAAAVLALGCVPAPASHCVSRIAVFSRTEAQSAAGMGSVNPNAPACLADGAEGADTRVLLPLAAEISVRYARDLSPAASLTAVVNGLGFVNRAVTLTRDVDEMTGAVTYNSAYLRIPNGAGAAGTIRVTVTHPSIPGGSDAVCFHTVDASC